MDFEAWENCIEKQHDKNSSRYDSPTSNHSNWQGVLGSRYNLRRASADHSNWQGSRYNLRRSSVDHSNWQGSRYKIRRSSADHSVLDTKPFSRVSLELTISEWWIVISLKLTALNLERHCEACMPWQSYDMKFKIWLETMFRIGCFPSLVSRLQKWGWF